MQDEYDDFEDDQGFGHAGLGAKKRGMSKNQQIYGDFYQAYQEQPQMNVKKTYGRSSYSNFRAGSTIQNYAAECDVHIPEVKPKKKVKLDEEQEQAPEVGEFNLQSFLRSYQQKQELQEIQEESEQQSYDGPLCLNDRIKKALRLVKLGEQEDDYDLPEGEQLNLSEMTFQQYKRLVMRNDKNEVDKTKKKPLTAEEKQKEKEFVQSYGIGYKMLSKMGYSLNKGLGKDEKGISKPIQAVFKTAFTTKDSELKKEQQKKKQELETQQEEQDELQVPENKLFMFRSRNIKINNFLLDLKNAFEKVSSKMYFYEKELKNCERDEEINSSIRLQRQNELQECESEIKKLEKIKDCGSQLYAKKGLRSRGSSYPHPHIALTYGMDKLYVKQTVVRLKSLPQERFCDEFPSIIEETHKFLTNLYKQKERESIIGYSEGIKGLTTKGQRIINLQEQIQIDLTGDGENLRFLRQDKISEEESSKISNLISLVAENTLIPKVEKIFSQYRSIEDMKDYKVLECLKVVKTIQKQAECIKNLIENRIKPLVRKYYSGFIENWETTQGQSRAKYGFKDKGDQFLPHLVIFPLFEVMEPRQLQLGMLLNRLSTKLWNLKSGIFHPLIKPLLAYCTQSEKNNFIDFFLSPRLLYHLQEFELSQPALCKELLTMMKLYKEFLPEQTLKDLLNNTIIPEVVMTYRKYEEEGTEKKELNLWLARWEKEVGKIVPNYIAQVLTNEFGIKLE